MEGVLERVCNMNIPINVSIRLNRFATGYVHTKEQRRKAFPYGFYQIVLSNALIDSRI